LARPNAASGVEYFCGDNVLGAGEYPIGAAALGCYRAAIKLLLLTIVFLLLFIGGGYSLGGLVIGGSVILSTFLIVFLTGAYRANS
jgi:hypothetical protein